MDGLYIYVLMPILENVGLILLAKALPSDPGAPGREV